MSWITSIRKALVSAWAKILVHLPSWFRLWWMRRGDERQLRLLDKEYDPLIEAARKAKDHTEESNLYAGQANDRGVILDPTYGLTAEILEKKARKLGIRVPDKNEEKGDWIRSSVTGDWMLTDEAERRLRNEIREEQRASADEWRKWATLFFVVVGSIFAFLSYRTKQRQPDPCPVNYYRNDSGACVFALPVAPNASQPRLPTAKPKTH